MRANIISIDVKNSFVVVNFQILKTLAKLRVLSRNHFQWACPCRIKLLLLAISRAYRGIIYLLSGEMEKLLFEQREMGWMKRKTEERAWFKGEKTLFLFYWLDWCRVCFSSLWTWKSVMMMNISCHYEPIDEDFTPRKIKSYFTDGSWFEDIWQRILKRQKRR